MGAYTLQAAVTQIQAYARSLSGIREAPALLEDKAPADGPFAATAPGRFVHDGGTAPLGIHKEQTVTTLILVPRRNMRLDLDKLYAYGDLFPEKLWNNPTLGDTVSTITRIQGEFHFEFIWGDKKYIGWKFETSFVQEDQT